MSKTANGTAKFAAPSPRNGNRLPLGNHPGNTGGKKGRSGPKPDAWKAACEQALNDAKAVPVLTSMISGDIKEQVGVDRQGEPIYGETRNADRLGAVKFLAAYAHGQPKESVELEGDITIRVVYDA